MKVAVTSRSFSKNQFLRNELLNQYPDSYFNDQGLYFNSEELIDFLKPAQAAIIGLEHISEVILSKTPQLKIISKYGVGLDNIQFSALRKYNVCLGYTPGTNRRGVAELALQMMMTLLRKSYQSNLAMRKGSWTPQFGKNLTHKKIGILGLGNIGKELVKLLAPFECQIYCHDIKPDIGFIKDHGLHYVELNELFIQSDIVTIHIPLNKNTQLLVNNELLSLLSSEAILINTSRGGIVDEQVLIEKLKNGTIQAAGFDVFMKEPYLNDELLLLDHFYSTPHIGGSSVESVQAMGMAAIDGLSRAIPIITDEWPDL